MLGASSEAARDAETLKLLDYGFSLYHPVRPVEQGEQLADPRLDYRGDHLLAGREAALPVSVREGQQAATQVSAPDEVSGAVEPGQALGRVTVSVDGRLAAATPAGRGPVGRRGDPLDKVVCDGPESDCPGCRWARS